jgi:hypothetical protein
MHKPTQKQLTETNMMIDRGGKPREYIQSVSLEDFETVLRYAAYYHNLWLDAVQVDDPTFNA